MCRVLFRLGARARHAARLPVAGPEESDDPGHDEHEVWEVSDEDLRHAAPYGSWESRNASRRATPINTPPRKINPC
jgi:hypothetical protein